MFTKGGLWRNLLCISLAMVGFGSTLNAQIFEKLGDLPANLSESSGIEAIGNGFYISHNDGGNPAEIYLIDSLGKVAKTIKVVGYPNTDWEDISLDENGSLFIGDFGNNDNKRKDLTIGVVTGFLNSLPDTIYPKVISFKFEDQREFPPSAQHLEFDCEAISVYKDSIYLITKNRSNPYNGWAKLYVLPNEIGNHTAKLVDSIETGTIKEIAWITGLDIRSKEMVLVGSAFVWLYEFTEVPRFEKLKGKFEVFPISQKEAIAFDGNSFVLTDESFGGFGAFYRFSNFENLGLQLAEKQAFQIRWMDDLIQINSNLEIDLIEVYNLSGQLVWQRKNIEQKMIRLNPASEGIQNGIFLMKLFTRNGQYAMHKIIVK